MSKTASTSESFPRKFGKYHLLGPLAQGGMGALYLALTGDKGFERLLCIKTVIPHLADEEYVARFRDEAKVVVRLSHGNLIPVFDAGQVEGELFLAMDFVKGKDLRAVWNRCAKKGVAFPVDVAVHLTKELCRGLGYAHRFGDIRLVHRDVSPPNILVSYAGDVKLTDFGLASSTMKLEKTAPGIIYGKVAYMSPEQARGEGLDGRSDIYAAGIVLWELLTGRQLFPPGDAQPQDLIKRAKNPAVQAPSERAPRVPKDLDRIVRKALAADREERYATAEEFRDALGEWLAINSPTTDNSTVEQFVRKLFSEDIEREESERRALIDKTRERVKTLPPNDELRKLFERVGAKGFEEIHKAADRRQEPEGPNKGRRAPDKGKKTRDRRASSQRGRRLVDVAPSGKAVSVPKAGPQGATVVRGGGGNLDSAALARARQNSLSGVIGQVLDSRYEVKKLIGEGGMGRVYLAEHVDIGKQVAVKILHPVYGRMPDLVERFRREARAASKIGHPNIVDVTDSGTTADGSVYFVMEYLEGIELGNVLEREHTIEARRAIDICTQVCRALAAAHAVGIIHRDLKPENIFLTPREGTTDFVKVFDFGIAKSTELEEARAKKLTSPGMAMGTPEYMAPEQAAGKTADARCDVYSLGAILYEMVTGVAPYEGANFMEILTRKATQEPQAPKELDPSIPDKLSDLIMRAMARSPEDRPQGMTALEYELTKCIAGRGAAVANALGISQTENFESITSPGAPAFESLPEEETPTEEVLPGPPPEVIATDSIPVVSGGAYRTFGWVLFGLLLLAGVLAVFYVASGESRAPRTKSASGEEILSPDKAALLHEVPGNPAIALDAGIAYAELVLADAQVAPEAAAADAAPIAADAAEVQVETRDPVKAARRGPPRSNREANLLLREAKVHVARLEFEAAKEKYQRVASGKFRKQLGFLGLADVAFQNKQADRAIQYAKKAGDSIQAHMVLGNAYFKKGEFSAALELYNSVLERKPDHKEAQGAARAARKRLGIGQ